MFCVGVTCLAQFDVSFRSVKLYTCIAEARLLPFRQPWWCVISMATAAVQA